MPQKLTLIPQYCLMYSLYLNLTFHQLVPFHCIINHAKTLWLKTTTIHSFIHSFTHSLIYWVRSFILIVFLVKTMSNTHTHTQSHCLNTKEVFILVHRFRVQMHKFLQALNNHYLLLLIILRVNGVVLLMCIWLC